MNLRVLWLQDNVPIRVNEERPKRMITLQPRSTRELERLREMALVSSCGTSELAPKVESP